MCRYAILPSLFLYFFYYNVVVLNHFYVNDNRAKVKHIPSGFYYCRVIELLAVAKIAHIFCMCYFLFRY